MPARNSVSDEKGIVLVTGGTGLIGRYVVRRLVDAGAEVRLLARNPARIEAGVAPHIDIVKGDVRDGATVERAVQGARRVVHLAAYAKAWSRDASEFSAVNVDAVRSLVDRAAHDDVERFVHVSTILTLPPHRPAPVGGAAARETFYEATKHAGEDIVAAWGAADGRATILHPTRVYGPGELNDANGVTKAVWLYLRGRLRLCLDEGDSLANYVHADDVAAGIVAATFADRPAPHYVLGGEDASFADVLGLASREAGLHRRTLAVGPRLAVAIAAAMEACGPLGVTPLLTRGWVRALLEDRRADSSPARRDLGYQPRDLATGVRETVAWLLESHMRGAA